MVSPTPSSGTDTVVRTLVITINSVMGLKARDVYLVISLAGDQKQHTPVHKKGSMNPWSGHTFVFTVDKAAVPTGCLKFKIMAKRTLFPDKDVGEVDVPVGYLLLNGSAGNMKPKVLSHEVRLSSEETEAVVKFSYQFSGRFPVEVPPVDEPVKDYADAVYPQTTYQPNATPNYPAVHPANEAVAGYAAAVATLASNTAAAHMPPLTVATQYPQTAYQSIAMPNYPSAHLANETVTGYAPAAASPASNTAATHMPPLNVAAQHPQTAYQPNAMPNHPSVPPTVMNADGTIRGYLVAPAPPAEYPSPMPGAAPYFQMANLPNAVPTCFYPPPANVHPQAGQGNAAPTPHAGGNFVQKVMSRVAVDAISDVWNQLMTPDTGFDM
ncbi:hypothetical protein BT93_L3449 [Corymbia citriodora subsp. variegata]|uniref:C2 domain-containing protein n=1 Tax=Corymbia citriodora subsp. variegata TaxID=360336 RepID=A0A8T0CWV9_CORYI|nr:hypothetical protein BT93_L3449 [Corymbia citriodora subsp. variegata]